jgi:L-lactate dehydrogenase complex protein LldF
VTAFADRVRAAIDDDHLHVALDRATGQLGLRRSMAFASLDDAEAVRDRARAAKFAILRTLGDSLRAFERAVQQNGGHVHWAETGEDANRIVVEIARRAGARRAIKSKSMVSEEIHLNAALERAGLVVVETDLGEYIAQLACHRPSHIILPIAHMTREDVGTVMHARLNVPYSDDTQTLARYARERLREEFLQADLGITGANFGVVETGTICLVTNEGNGRMVTTLPRVHVALIGIEKLVPTLADLDLVLKVLARSATGQKLSVYTTLVRGPRRSGDECGPQELHVVLIDNGRAGMLEGDTAEILACIRCGACLNACPVYRTIGGHAYGDIYPGPVGAVVTPGLRGLDGWAELPAASTLCGACREICPVRLDIPRMLLALRRRAAQETAQPLWLRAGMRLFAWTATRPRLYRRVLRATRHALRRRAIGGWLRDLPGPGRAWTASRDLRAPAAESFDEQWRKRARRGTVR